MHNGSRSSRDQCDLVAFKFKVAVVQPTALPRATTHVELQKQNWWLPCSTCEFWSITLTTRDWSEIWNIQTCYATLLTYVQIARREPRNRLTRTRALWIWTIGIPWFGFASYSSNCIRPSPIATCSAVIDPFAWLNPAQNNQRRSKPWNWKRREARLVARSGAGSWRDPDSERPS